MNLLMSHIHSHMSDSVSQDSQWPTNMAALYSSSQHPPAFSPFSGAWLLIVNTCFEFVCNSQPCNLRSLVVCDVWFCVCPVYTKPFVSMLRVLWFLILFSKFWPWFLPMPLNTLFFLFFEPCLFCLYLDYLWISVCLSVNNTPFAFNPWQLVS